MLSGFRADFRGALASIEDTLNIQIRTQVVSHQGPLTKGLQFLSSRSLGDIREYKVEA